MNQIYPSMVTTFDYSNPSNRFLLDSQVHSSKGINLSMDFLSYVPGFLTGFVLKLVLKRLLKKIVKSNLMVRGMYYMVKEMSSDLTQEDCAIMLPSISKMLKSHNKALAEFQDIMDHERVLQIEKKIESLIIDSIKRIYDISLMLKKANKLQVATTSDLAIHSAKKTAQNIQHLMYGN